jgi:hypothetical protein
MEEEENGFDELMRLSQQFTRQEREHTEMERQRREQGKKTQDVLQGLRGIKVSMALEQLKAIAPPEILAEVEALKVKKGSDDLRKAISALVDEMENRFYTLSSSNPEMAPLSDSMRTLSILLDLYFSL